jgi:hypothetical protein
MVSKKRCFLLSVRDFEKKCKKDKKNKPLLAIFMFFIAEKH